MTIADAARAMDLPALSQDLPDHLWKEWVDVHLALAFGHVKMTGRCPREIAVKTTKMIALERTRAEADRTSPQRNYWLERLARYDAKLTGFL